MSPTVLCAIADDDRLHDVVATGRVLGRTGRLRPMFVHVGQPARMAPAPAGSGAGAAAIAHAREDPTVRAERVGTALLEEAGVWDEPTILTAGDAVDELNRLSAEYAAALIVIASHGKGLLAGALLGSVSRSLVRAGRCPVLIARPTVLPCLGGPVVCAVDLADDRHARTAHHAALLAAWMDRPLVLVHVLRLEYMAGAGGPVMASVAIPPSAQDRAGVRRRLRALAAELPAEEVESVVLDAAPVAPRLDEFAAGRRADLLVVGSRGCGPLRTALEGSVSLDLMRTGTRPLVVVPPGACATPAGP